MAQSIRNAPPVFVALALSVVIASSPRQSVDYSESIRDADRIASPGLLKLGERRRNLAHGNRLHERDLQALLEPGREEPQIGRARLNVQEVHARAREEARDLVRGPGERGERR